MLLELRNAVYSYESNDKAINNVSLCINDGDFVAVMGKSGCGKTTLLKIMSGLIKPDSGFSSLHGAGFLFQNSESLFFSKSVIDEVVYGILNCGMEISEARILASDALRQVGIDSSLFEKDPFKLSGGEKRKVALACVLAYAKASESKVLLLDEPDSGLDSRSCSEIMESLKALNLNGMTVVMVTHNSNLAYRYANRLVILDNGKIAVDGTVTEIFHSSRDLSCFGIDTPEIVAIRNAVARACNADTVEIGSGKIDAQSVYGILRKFLP